MSPTSPSFVRPTPLASRAPATRAERPYVRNGLERFVDTLDKPRSGHVAVRMSSPAFMNALANHDTVLIGIANSDAKPTSSEAQELSLTKTAGSTVNAIFFGAPHRAKRAAEAPEGSPDVLHNVLSGGVRFLAAAFCMTTVFIPVAAGVVGFARGRAASTRKGVVRQYKRHMVQGQVLDPLKNTLAASPSRANAGDREAVKAFLSTCKKNKRVAAIVRGEDIKFVKTWLADHPPK